LIEKGADVKTSFDAEGQTPLMYAAHGGNLAIVEAMIAKGAQANHKTPTGVTALSIALGSPEASEAVVNKLRRLVADEAPTLDF
jgi:ankyrin repeat protein